MAFVVDGAEWSFEGWTSEQLRIAVENLLDRVQTARDRKETVWIGDDLQSRRVLGELDLWSLRSPNAPLSLPPETWQELSAWLGPAPRYLDEEVWPAGATEVLVQIDHDAAEENPDLAWAHHNVRAGRPFACFGLVRSGMYETTTNFGKALIHWVSTEEGHRAFWRAAIDVVGDNEASLERLSSHAFPDLHFHDNVFHGLKRLVGGYPALRTQIRKYLTALDDNGKWVFVSPPPALDPRDEVEPEVNMQPTNQVIERRFLGFNLNMAPENPDVYANKKCREAREITLGARTFYCEWHGKLEIHQNRIHVHPPVAESKNKVVIAIFDKHLPLP